MFKKISFIIASWFGVGFMPKASGTFGSLAALPFIYFAQLYFGFFGVLVFAIAMFALGTIASKEVLKYTTHDPKEIVIDEVVGQSIALLYLSINPSWQTYVLGFAFFRFFDILKPWPVGYVDKKIENEYGVMLDDVLAGLYALLGLYVCDQLF